MKYTIIFVGILLVLIAGALFLLKKPEQVQEVNIPERINKTAAPTTVPTDIIQPTLAPVSDKVKSIGEDNFVLTGEKGDIILPMDERVKIYRKDQTIADFKDLKIGQSVMMDIKVPGKEIILTLE